MNSRSLGRLLHAVNRLHSPKGDTVRGDAELLERFARRGDHDAFAELVRRHGPMVLGACRRLVPDRHESEDAFQATFLILARRAGSLTRGGPLAPWLHGVAVRVALRLRRQSSRRPATLAEDVPAEGEHAEPSDEVAWREVRAALDEEIRRLPEKYRRPVVLCYLQGQTYAEAARSLGWPAGTVSVRLARARQRLRQRLTRRELGVPAAVLASLPGGEALTASVPALLLVQTVRWGTAAGVGGAAVLGPVPAQVTALAEGALHAMSVTKSKIVLGAVLAVSLLGVGFGGVAWRYGSQAGAQQPTPAPAGSVGDELQRIEANLRRVETELRDLRAKRDRLLQSRHREALDQIAAAVQKLKEATADDPKRREAVQTFERAFEQLKGTLGGERLNLDVPFGSRVTKVWDLTDFELTLKIPSDGEVIRVDPERKQVLLSAGSDDGVRQGQVYRVYQGGKATPDQTGWIRISRVEPKWSVATIEQDYGPRAPIRPRDIIQLDR